MKLQFNSEWRTTLLFIFHSLCLVFSDRAIDSERSWESSSSHSALPVRQQSEQEWDQQRTWMLPSKYARLLLHLRNHSFRLGYWGRGDHFISSYSFEIMSVSDIEWKLLYILQGFTYPPHVGMSLGTSIDPVYVQMEIHFDNPSLQRGTICYICFLLTV